jgi:hypothetical protein
MAADVLSPKVQDFDRVAIRIHNHVCKLNLSQGNSESLQIRGPSRLLDRISTEVHEGELTLTLGGSLANRIGDSLTTSLTRKSIEVALTVRKLAELDLAGFIQGTASPLLLDKLMLSFAGLGKLAMAELQTETLSAELQGSPFVELKGAVSEQQVTITGMGQYRAGGLKSQRTSIQLSGSGFATVWATAELEIVVNGMGSVEYYGQPKLRRRSTGMASLKALGIR